MSARGAFRSASSVSIILVPRGDSDVPEEIITIDPLDDPACVCAFCKMDSGAPAKPFELRCVIAHDDAQGVSGKHVPVVP